MNPIINVRISKQVLKQIEPDLKEEGYSNIQELIKTLLREYKLKKEKEKERKLLLELYGSQKGGKASKEELSRLAEEHFYNKL